jgi:hypothetical protein
MKITDTQENKKALKASLISLISKVLLVLTIRSSYVLLHGFYYFFAFLLFVYTTFIFLVGLSLASRHQHQLIINLELLLNKKNINIVKTQNSHSSNLVKPGDNNLI